MDMLDVTTVRTAGELEARPRSTYTKHERLMDFVEAVRCGNEASLKISDNNCLCFMNS